MILGERSAEGGSRDGRLALREAKQRESGLGLAAPIARLEIKGVGVVQLPSESAQLGPLIHRVGDRVVVSLGQARTRA